MERPAQGNFQTTSAGQGTLNTRTRNLLGILLEHNANQRGYDYVPLKRNSIDVVELVAGMISKQSGPEIAVVRVYN